MVEVARANYPAIPFRQADAEALPYPNGSFDLAANGFGLWHLGDPDAALREACRILRPGGRFAFTTWLPPDQGFDLFGIVLGAIRQYGTLDVPLPPAPPPFRFADPAEAGRALEAAGFGAIAHERRLCLWQTRDAANLLDLIFKSLVRAPMLIEHQQPEAKEHVKADIVARAEAFRSGDLIKLRFPYLLVTATRLSLSPFRLTEQILSPTRGQSSSTAKRFSAIPSWRRRADHGAGPSRVDVQPATLRKTAFGPGQITIPEQGGTAGAPRPSPVTARSVRDRSEDHRPCRPMAGWPAAHATRPRPDPRTRARSD